MKPTTNEDQKISIIPDMSQTLDESNWITLKEARRLTNRGKTTIRNWIKAGKLIPRKGEGECRVPKDTVLALDACTPRSSKSEAGSHKVGKAPAAEDLRTMSTSRLRPHPLSAAIYGTEHDPRLLESVKEKGILSPLVVTDDGQVISGGERLWAAQETGLAEVPVCIVPTADETEIKLLVLEANVARNKTNEQRIREYQVYKEIEAAKAQVRQKAGTDLVSNLTQGSGKARDLAAEKVGWGGTTAEKGSRILNAMEEHVTESQLVGDVRGALNASVDGGFKKAAALGWLGTPPTPKEASAVKTYQRAKTAASKLVAIVKADDALFTPEQIKELRRVLAPIMQLIDASETADQAATEVMS